MNNLLVGGAFLGVMASMWSYIQAFGWKVVNCFVQYIEIGSSLESTSNAVINKLMAEYKLSPIYDRVVGDQQYRFRDSGKYGNVILERFGFKTLVFWNRFWPIIYSVSIENGTINGSSFTKDNVRMIFLRGTLDYKRFMKEAIDSYNALLWGDGEFCNNVRDRYAIVEIPSADSESIRQGWSAPSRLIKENFQQVPISCNHEDVGPDLARGSKLATLFYPDEVRDEIDNAVRWAKSVQVYKSMGIPHKRGWQLHGPPGTGKSALADAIAHDLNMPIFVFRLAGMSNFEFIKHWKSMRKNTPCVALFEDFDNVFHGRKNVTGDTSFDAFFSRVKTNGPSTKSDDEDKIGVNSRFGNLLTFDVFLNCLDGVDRSDGVFTIITANDPSKIDPALGVPVAEDGFASTRPGRIDNVIELTYMTQEVKGRMAEHFLRDFPKTRDFILQENRGDFRVETPAQFQERIGQLALKEYWSNAQPQG